MGNDRGAIETGTKVEVNRVLRAPVFSDLDRRFAQLIQREDGGSSDLVALAAAVVSYQLRRGEVFLDLTRAPVWEEPGEAPLADWPNVEVWMEDLRSSPAVGMPGEGMPLVLTDSGKLYLHRYWVYEKQLAEKLREHSNAVQANLSRETIAQLEALFEGAPEQRDAARNALTRSFSLISGGPGTGKTTTVLKILVLMLERDPGLVIRLAAPTGKAAARLQESIRTGIERLDCSHAIQERIRELQASTVHRLLGAIAGSVHFRHNDRNPLAVDLIVLDEASMVDLPLMAKFFLALPAGSRVILLGDADQLTSVEAGSVLSGIVEAATGASGEPKGPPLAGVATLLRKNFRFGNESGIFRVCTAIRSGADSTVVELLRDPAITDLVWHELPESQRLKANLRPVVLQQWRTFLAERDPEKALEAFAEFQLLTAVRKGPFGKENVNLCVEEILREEGIIPIGKRNFPGRPFMVTENDYALRLFNGDIGVFLEDEEGQLMAFLRNEDGSLRKVSPLRLPTVETAFAMTVHKSQGSEFGEILVILPSRETPVLTRELLYTAISRARRGVEIWADEEILRLAVGRKVVRGSGFVEMLANV